MKRPEPSVAPPLRVPSRAIEVKAEGRIRARCIITTEGKAEHCVLLETIPYMSEAALWALTNQQYQPAEKNGEPIAVDYEYGWDVRLPPKPGAAPEVPSEAKPPVRVNPNARMTRPVKISGPEMKYTPRALCNRVEGELLVHCTITEKGDVESCRVLRTVPYMEDFAVRALESSKFRPATFDGRPQRIGYTFKFRLALRPAPR
nr:energy transducer TonB [Polyangium spumosum]